MHYSLLAFVLKEGTARLGAGVGRVAQVPGLNENGVSGS